MDSTDHTAPPGADDEDAYIYIDHREEEEAIVEYVSTCLAPEDALEAVLEEEQLSVRHRGDTYPVPLQISRHDRYIMLSSLAELLKDRYRFFLLVPQLGDDTHGLLVVPEHAVQAWPAVPEHLAPLDLGYDYFSGIRVPYLHYEDSAPDFADERRRVEENQAFMGNLVGAILSGRIDDDLIDKLARSAMHSPDAQPELAGMSEAEIADRLRQDFADNMNSEEFASSMRERDQARSKLKVLIAPPKRPWWKFW